MLELMRSLNMELSLAEALKKENILHPTEIQQKVIPEALKNKDLIAQSETGTGKTLAYLLPLFSKLDTSKSEMQAMILVPTHELAMQIQRQIERLAQNSNIKASSAPLIGNVNIQRQIDKLKEKPHILVGSPGRIMELIQKKKVTAHTIKTIILDEADKLLEDANLEHVKAVIKSTLKERQLLAFSATISARAEARAKELMKEPQVLRSEKKATVPTNIEHLSFLADQREKFEVLRKILRIIDPPKAIIFTGPMEEAGVITEKLKYHGFKADGIQGRNIKSDRKKAMDDFRTGKVRILVASDIAARGLHMEGITHVINLNMPEDPQEYLHRVGRTGRNGMAGVAVSIMTKRELQLARQHEKTLKIKLIPKVLERGAIEDVRKPAVNKQDENPPLF